MLWQTRKLAPMATPGKKTAGAAGVAANQNTAQPVIVRVTYQAAITDVNWNYGTGLPAQVTLIDGSGATFPYPASGTSAEINRDLTQGGPWSVTVSVNGGSVSEAMPIVTTTTAATLVENTGSGLSAAWNAAPGYTLYFAQLSQSGSAKDGEFVTKTSYLFQTPLNGTGWQLQIFVCVAQGGGNSFGPPVTYTPILVSPQMTRVEYDSNDVTLEWSPVSGFNYVARLQQGVNPPTTQQTSQPTCDFPGVLSGTGWTANVSVKSSDGVLIGPPSQTYTVILETPVMTTVNYTVSQLLLTWQAVSGYTWYVAELYESGQTNAQAVQALQYSFPGALIGTGWQCTVRARSTDGVSIGPAAGPYTPILTAPAITELDYDAGVVALTWSPASDFGITSYLLQLESGSQQQFALGVSGSQNVPVNLSAMQIYVATLRAVNGIVLGPWSQALTAISAAPANAYLGFDGTTLQGRFQPIAQSQVTGYLSALSGNGTVIATVPSASGSVNFNHTLTAGMQFSLQVRATGAQVKGPWSPPTAGPWAVSWLITYDPFGRLKTLTWNNTQQQIWLYDSAGNLLSKQITP